MASTDVNGATDISVEPVKIAGKTLVFIDLETTGLESDCGIVQIAAMYGETIFNRYVWPCKSIHPKAAEVHKITVDEDRMYLSGQLVDHVDCRQAMKEFAEFLNNVPGQIVLVAHNGRRFDFPRLVRAMKREQVPMPSNVVNLLDTLAAFRSLWPRLSSYRLQSLVEIKLERDADVDAHNAASDTRTLQELVGFVPAARHLILERFLDDAQLFVVEQSLGDLALESPRPS